MIKLPMNPVNLSDRELIDLIVNSASNDDPFVAELAKRLEDNLPCEQGCTCDSCMVFCHMEYLQERVIDLEYGYPVVDPYVIWRLIDMAKLAVVNIAALFGVELNEKGEVL